MYLEKFIFGRMVRELCAGCGYVGPQTNRLRKLFSQIYIRRPHRLQVQIASSALEKNLTSYNWTTKMTLAFLAIQMSSKTTYKACFSRHYVRAVISYGDCPFPPSGNTSPCWWSHGILPVPCRGPRSIADCGPSR